MAKTDYTDKLKGFADRVKKEEVSTPLQKVVPILAIKEEAQLNVWIPKSLLKRLKSKGLDIDKSLKEMTIEALESYL